VKTLKIVAIVIGVLVALKLILSKVAPGVAALF